MLEIELLGHVHVRSDGRPLELPNWRLLVHLLVHRGRPLAREQVAYELWPESGDAQALTNLRRELHLLRRALPGADELLRVSRRTIEWPQEGPYALDVATFEDATEPGGPDELVRLERAIRVYGGDLAPAIYDEWIAPHRERLRARYRDALERLVDALEMRRDYRAALEPARRLVSLDPLDEAGYRAQMRLAMRLGDRAMGLRAFEACVDALRRELDVEPSPETREAYERLVAGAGRDARSVDVPRPASPEGLVLVGRETELEALVAAGEDAQRGGPRLAVVHGEPGIGKTRLIEEVVTRWTAAGRAAAVTRSYAAEGSLAYAPVASWLRSAATRRGIGELEAVWLSELARLVPELLSARADVEPPPPMTESWQRQRLFEALRQAIRGVSAPLLLVLDDAHWADTDTLEWLHFLLRSDPTPPVFVLLGVRAEEERSNAALMALLLDARAGGRVVETWLSPLSEDATSRLAASLSGGPLDAEVSARLFHDTGGHPLFLVEMLRSGFAAAEAGAKQDGGGAAAPGAASPAIPPRIRAVISARLERLPGDSRQLVEIAGVVGRDFTVELVSRAGGLDQMGVAAALDDLWQRQIIREQSAGSYDFVHDWIRDVAAELIPPGRRHLLHRRVAAALERSDAGDLDAVAGRLAAHYEAAGMIPEAIGFHERAGRLEARLSSYGKALAHFGRALDLLGRLPQSADRDRRELALQLARSGPLNATLGYAAEPLETTLNRALELAETLGARSEEVLALNGLYSVHFVRGSIRRSVEFAQAALDRIEGDRTLLSTAWMAVGGTLSSLGELDRSIAAFDASMDAFDPATSRAVFGLDPAVFTGAWSSHALWLKGRWEAARARAAGAVDRARALEHPFMQALAHAYSAILCQLRGDEPGMLEHAQVAQALCVRYAFPYYGDWGAILEAWSERNVASDSASRIEAALDRLSSIRAASRWPYYLQLLADAHLAARRTGAARAVLDAAVVTASANDDRWWLPEVYRALGQIDEAPLPFLERALDLALQQHSYALAVRAATDLGRLDPGRTPALANAIAGMADGLEDLAAAAPLGDLATVH